MVRSKGFIPSPKHLLGLGHPSHLGTSTPPRAAEVALGPVVDQGMLSSCTGNSSAVAIQAKMPKVDGAWATLPSRLFLYYHARALEDSIDQDPGAMISDIFDAAAKIGFCPEDAWSYPDVLADPDVQFAKCVANPDAMAYHRAADQKLVKGAFRLTSYGQSLVDDVKRAIAAGYPVVWGTELDEAFETIGATHVWPGVTGRVIGGHAMVLHKYDGDVFWSRSSWGPGFADAGSARISAAAVASPHASEFWIVELAPQFSEVA